MDILIIGGTRFLGRALCDSIMAEGHNLTLFNRGQTNPDLYPELERIQGDRETDLTNLGDRHWDVVIDTCGYVPRIVDLSVQYLKDKVEYYVFISTISVYVETEEVGIDENAPLIELEDPTTEDIMGTPESYGGLKVLCERKVVETFGEKAIIVRPGLIIGPHDPTNRFTYWPVRMRKGGDILAPGDGSFPLQFIDVRDLADFTLHLAETQTCGYFNATGPQTSMALSELLSTCEKLFKTDGTIHWAPDDFLLDHEVSPWMEMPLWIPTKAGEALMQVNIDNARTHGMQFRPLEQTIHDTLNWYDSSNGSTKDWPAGLAPEKEEQLLKKLK